MTSRCFWAKSPLDIEYHDAEWGVPLHDDQKLFEFLILEGAQAGLSWATILKKRQHYRSVFDQFDPNKVARYGEAKIADLLADAGIIRNRLKINAAIINAQRYLDIQQQYGSFDAYLWAFVDRQPMTNHWRNKSEVPATTAISDQLSKSLSKAGFKFVGSTICYALMQAVGMVNDHTIDCFRHAAIATK